MMDFEKLGVFYLGRAFDLGTGKPKDDLILYDAKDLVTHAVCVGMTGSGKTGLCISLLEEAAIDGIPAICVDPKGDLTNLLLTFPRLAPEDFLPWVNSDDARTKGISVEEYAAKQAELWKNGLASWGQDGARIQRFKDSVETAIYTPGSTAGIPISILKSFAAPPASLIEDSELFAERVSTVATSLLTLMGIEADPMQSREHILISTILGNAWSAGEDLDLAALIMQIQKPPVTRIGVLDLDSFYPPSDRFKLAMALNSVLAAPGFSVWLEGEALDVGNLLYTPQGKPKLSVISIAHLNDAQRMFFVSLLLNQILGWMRTQSGTTSLRALFYMDEIFGYFPPVANPPSKPPLLTLLKQARAFGLGVMLATQNPVDLDYKGLSNTGTWFIGRLQTERDKARVLEGLEGASASASARFDRGAMEETLAGLGSRVFLMQNVHEDAPEVFQTRWALSYLRGPLTREQIKTLMAGRKPAPPVGADVPAARETSVPAARRGAATTSIQASARPVLPPGVPEYFLADRGRSPGALTYDPVVLGTAEIRFVDTKLDVDTNRSLQLQATFDGGVRPVDWDRAEPASYTVDDLETEPADGAAFGELPSAASNSRSYTAWSRDLAAWLSRSQSLELKRSVSTGLVSKLDESDREFRLRVGAAARERRDEASERLRRKYAPKLATLEERLRVAENAVEREEAEARDQKAQAAVSIGATILGAFLGRKRSSIPIGRASTAMGRMSRTMRQSGDVGRAQERVAVVRQQLEDLESEFQSELAATEAATDPLTEEFETITVRPKKADVVVDVVALVWVPREG